MWEGWLARPACAWAAVKRPQSVDAARDEARRPWACWGVASRSYAAGAVVRTAEAHPAEDCCSCWGCAHLPSREQRHLAASSGPIAVAWADDRSAGRWSAWRSCCWVAAVAGAADVGIPWIAEGSHPHCRTAVEGTVARSGQHRAGADAWGSRAVEDRIGHCTPADAASCPGTDC